MAFNTENLKIGLMGFSDALTGNNTQANYLHLKQQAEKWRQDQEQQALENAYRQQQLDQQAQYYNYLGAKGQADLYDSGWRPAGAMGQPMPQVNPQAAMSMVGGGIGDVSGKPLDPTQSIVNDANFFKMKTPYGEMVRDVNYTKPTQDRLKNNDYFNQANKLMDDFDKLSKDFRSTRDAFARIEASAKDPSAAGDLAMIFNYMKTLDPGSTVREGEFATAQNSASLPNQVTAMYNKVLEGTRLAPEQRQDFLSRARKLYKSQATIQKKNIELYTKRATKFGIDPSDVITDLDDFNEADAEPEVQTFKVDGKTYNIPSDKVEAFKKAKGIK
jgi:hypothetical protein